MTPKVQTRCSESHGTSESGSRFGDELIPGRVDTCTLHALPPLTL